MDKFRIFESDDGGDETVNEMFEPVPVKKKRGRPSKAELAALQADNPTVVEATTWQPQGADQQTLEMLRDMTDPFTRRQAAILLYVDETTSTSDFDPGIRAGMGAASGGIAANPLAKSCVTVGLFGFNTACTLRSVARGGFAVPERTEYLVGTCWEPLRDKLVGVSRAFNQHVAAAGGVTAESMAVVVSDFHFDRHPLPGLTELKAALRASGVVLVSAMVGQFNRPVAAALSHPVPPVELGKVSFEALFTTLATSITSSLSGRGRLEALLIEEFGKLA